jgi:hypothetical protein
LPDLSIDFHELRHRLLIKLLIFIIMQGSPPDQPPDYHDAGYTA